MVEMSAYGLLSDFRFRTGRPFLSTDGRANGGQLRIEASETVYRQARPVGYAMYNFLAAKP